MKLLALPLLFSSLSFISLAQLEPTKQVNAEEDEGLVKVDVELPTDADDPYHLDFVFIEPEQETLEVPAEKPKEITRAVALVDAVIPAKQSILHENWTGGPSFKALNSADKQKLVQASSLLEQISTPESMLIQAKLLMFGYGSERGADGLKHAFEKFKQVADTNGNATAHFYMGLFYSNGFGVVERDTGLALLHFKMAALGENQFAYLALGYRFHLGITVEQSCDEAVQYYQSSASSVARVLRDGPFDNGQPPPKKASLANEIGGVYGAGASGAGAPEPEHSGLGYISKEDIIQFYQHNADRGDAQSQVVLGQIHYYGTHNIPKSFPKAIAYFRKAVAQLPSTAGSTRSSSASQTDAAAQAASFLGLMYWRGDGLKRENTTAFRWFKRAAEFGNPAALYYLGLMHYRGVVVRKNIESATKLWIKAAEKGNADAFIQLGISALNQRDYETAMRHFQMAGKQGNLLGYFYLGRIHSEGLGTRRQCIVGLAYYKNVAERGDFERPLLANAYAALQSEDVDLAFIRYAIAGELGFSVAQSNLAWLLETEKYRFRDENETLYQAGLWWNRAAIQGDVDARVKMGDYYYYGKGMPVDYKMALLYYLTAEQEMSSIAMFNLGYMYEYGIGVEQDFHMAKRYYTRALETNPDAYLPVTLSVTYLKMKYFFHWLRNGGTFFLDAHPESSKKNKIVEDHKSLLDDLLKTDESIIRPKEDEIDTENDELWHEEADDGELVFLIVLIAVAVYLFWQRQAPVRQQQQAQLHRQDAPR